MSSSTGQNLISSFFPVESSIERVILSISRLTSDQGRRIVDTLLVLQIGEHATKWVRMDRTRRRESPGVCLSH